MLTRLLCLVTASFVAVACTGARRADVSPGPSLGPTIAPASPSVRLSTLEATPATPTARASLPVDPSMEAVSRSSPQPAAQRALEACGFNDFQQRPLSMVAGMGKAPSGYAARDYAALSGNEPELMTEDPVWMIQLGGELPDPFTGEVSIDPLCISIGGDGLIYSVGEIILSDGTVYTPQPVPAPPRYSLPSLAP